MDLVGEASARLLAAGFPRDDRLGSLRLLGVLLTVAGPGGVIRRDLRQLAAEFGLPPDASERWLTQLATAGTVRLEDDAVVLTGRDDGDLASLRLDEFLGVVADLDERRRRRRGLARPVGAAVTAIAAAVGGVVLLPAALDEPVGPVVTDRSELHAPGPDEPPEATGDGESPSDGQTVPGGATPAPPSAGSAGAAETPSAPPATTAPDPGSPSAPSEPPGGDHTCPTVLTLDGVTTSVPRPDDPVSCLAP